MVITVSTPDLPVAFTMSTGIPLPLSLTVTDLSEFNITCTVSQCPAIASSTELSTISCIRCCKPSGPVVPIYIPGLFLTASSPSSTVISFAE